MLYNLLLARNRFILDEGLLLNTLFKKPENKPKGPVKFLSKEEDKASEQEPLSKTKITRFQVSKKTNIFYKLNN